MLKRIERHFSWNVIFELWWQEGDRSGSIDGRNSFSSGNSHFNNSFSRENLHIVSNRKGGVFWTPTFVLLWKSPDDGDLYLYLITDRFLLVFQVVFMLVFVFRKSSSVTSYFEQLLNLVHEHAHSNVVNVLGDNFQSSQSSWLSDWDQGMSKASRGQSGQKITMKLKPQILMV